MKNRLKKVISICLVALLLFSTVTIARLTVSATENGNPEICYISGDYAYGILENGMVQILDYFGNATNLEIPNEIEGKPVIKIGSFGGYDAFSGCESLTHVTIPDGVKYIWFNAFSGCENLQSVIIPDSVIEIGESAFHGCTSLNNVTIPDSVVSIGWYAFLDCTNLKNIKVPDSVINVGGGVITSTAWYEDQPDGLVYFGKVACDYKGYLPENSSIAFKEGTKGIGSDAFGTYGFNLKSVTIPDSVVCIGSHAFYGCRSLESITIPDSVTIIDWAAFEYCTSLETITIPDGVTIINRQTFENCTGLKSITIPDSVVRVYWDAFKNCTSLESISIPDGVEEIEEGTFDGCESLENITIPDSVTIINPGEFNGTKWYENQPDGLVYAGKVAYAYKGEMPQNTSITIIDGTKTLEDNLFSGCYNLAEVIIPNTVTRIGDNTFNGCTSLESVTIPDSITEICTNTFEGCTSLESVTIPDSVTIIHDDAFIDCTSLKNVTIPYSVKRIRKHALGYKNVGSGYEKIEDFTITGYSGTVAEWYAFDNGFKFISLGESPTEPTTTVITDKDTNVSVEGKIAVGVELNVENADTVVKNAVAAYNITLMKDGEAVQPDGSVTVKLPVPDGVDGSKCKVYNIDGDNKTDMNAVFTDGFLVFETDHFSVYAVVNPEEVPALLGDVNLDGKITVADATEILKANVDLVTLTDEQKKLADFDGNGVVNVIDASELQRAIVNS